MEKLKTGILVHGYNLQAHGWEHVVWGNPPDQLGRVPQALLTALQYDAISMVFGTGASQDTNGKSEALVTVEYMWENFTKLKEFLIFKNLDIEYLRVLVRRIISIETTSKNTEEEILATSEFFLTKGVEQMVLVSSPTHLPRCLLRACAVLDGDQRFVQLRNHLVAVPSHTSSGRYGPDKVIIAEPPHRPDRVSANRLYRILSRVNNLRGQPDYELDQIIEDINLTLRKHGI